MAPEENSAEPSADRSSSATETSQAPTPQDAGERTKQPEILNSSNINKLDAWQAQFASIIFNFLGSRERGQRAKLARSDFKPIPLDSIETEFLVCQETDMKKLASELNRNRLLVLTGEARIGKRTLAITLTRHLWTPQHPGAMHLLPQPPARDMQVNLLSLLEEQESAQSLILPNAFDGGNSELKRFFSGLTQERMGEITAQLQTRQAFLILTSDYDRLGEELGRRLKGLHLLYEVQPLSSELLEAGLRKRVESKISATEDDPDRRRKIDEMLDRSATISEIIRTLKTMPKIAAFVDEWFFLVATGGIELRQALRRASSLEDWLLFDLPKSFEEWSYTLALVICQASHLANPCSWLQFDLVRRELVRFLRRDLRRELKLAEKADSPVLGLDEALCRAARAEVRNSASPGASTIHFQDERHAEEIWEILFGSGRRLLSLLHGFCEQHVLSANSLVAEVAARALGRMGEIDPQGIVIRWMRELHALPDEEQRAARLGALFQGILASQNATYRDECLWYLQLQLTSSAVDAAAAAIQSLLWIGILDADSAALALANLRWVATQKLTPQLKDIPRLEAKLLEIEPWLQVIRSHPDRFRRTAEEEGLLAAFLFLFPEESHLSILLSIERTWVRLGFVQGPAWFLTTLQDWMKSPEPLLRSLTILLFLRLGGIADTLESIKLPFPAETGSRTFSSPDFPWLTVGLYSPQEGEYLEMLAGFLDAVSADLPSSSLPSLMKQEFRQRLRRLLRSWAKQGLSHTESREATLRLFRRLLNGESKLSADLCSWIRSSSDIAKDANLSLLRPLLSEVPKRP